MKIALPTKNDGTIDSHFGHCQFYTVCVVSDNGNDIQYERMDSPVGCGCKSNIVSTLRERGVSVMLTGNMGDGAVKVLKDNKIKVIRGCSGKVENVVRDYLDGKLLDSGVACSKHEGHVCGNNISIIGIQPDE